MVGRDHTYFLCSFPLRELGNVAKPWYSSPAGGTLSLFRFPQFHLNPLVKPTREMEIYNHCVYDCVCVCVCVVGGCMFKSVQFHPTCRFVSPQPKYSSVFTITRISLVALL